MRSLLGLGIGCGGCLMLVGLLSSCTIVLIPFGFHLIWVGFVVMVLFWLARKLVDA